MTSTIERTETVTAEPTPKPAPALSTFTVGTLTIEATSEEEALRKFRRLVRAEALKAQKNNNWCNSGTNERLDRLGLRRIGSGIPMKVTVTATRTTYIVVDAEDQDEAERFVADGGPDVVALAAASLGGGWKVSDVTAQPGRKPSDRYEVGDPDETVTGIRHQTETDYDIDTCGTVNAGWYCTKQAGHIDAGDMQHAAGNGRTIAHVWNGRRTTS